MKITIFTSGSTGEQKAVTHDETDFYKPAQFLCNKWKLDSNDIILNPFPTWTIAHWAFCFFPAQLSNCEVININFEPKKFWKQVDEIRPTILTLAIRTMNTMLKLETPNLTFMKNLCTGSAPVTEHHLSMMKKTGAQNLWNIYGSSECIPPVMMTQGVCFDFKDTPYYLEYDQSLIVDGFDTEDIFIDNQCLSRPNLNETWKSK
tara:strand:+ start:552 stop:1163 length:612 start_codon:yes stop_codon:yes gene_type:complete